MNDFWVFGYGSLIWQPGFAFVERQRARLFGYRRALCIFSHIYRGTSEQPGLVLGLDRGGSCLGVAFKVEAARRKEVMAYLRKREQVTGVYLERTLPLHLANGERIKAVAYIADREHSQYAGGLDVAKTAAIVRKACGQAGPNLDYVANTVHHLQALGIRDRWLEVVERQAAQ